MSIAFYPNNFTTIGCSYFNNMLKINKVLWNKIYYCVFHFSHFENIKINEKSCPRVINQEKLFYSHVYDVDTSTWAKCLIWLSKRRKARLFFVQTPSNTAIRKSLYACDDWQVPVVLLLANPLNGGIHFLGGGKWYGSHDGIGARYLII